MLAALALAAPIGALSGARAPTVRARSLLRSRAALAMSADAVDMLGHAHAALEVARPLAEAHALALSALLADATGAAAPAAGAVVDAAAPAVGTVASSDNGPIALLAKGVALAITAIHDTLSAQGVTKPYGLSIILFTLIIKVVLFPLNFQQIKSTTQMQAIQPKVAAIRAKYPNAAQDASQANAVNTEIAALYQAENLNPLAGCLPSLAQIPVFIALYRALINLAKADLLEEPFLWIPSLEGPVKEQGMGLGWLTEWVNGQPQFGWPDTLAYLSLPLILVLCQAASFSVLTPPTSDPNQQRTQDILKFLPLMIGFFSLSTPAGLVVYWVVNSILTTVQTLGIRALIGYTPPEAAPAAPAPTPGAAPPAAPSKGFGAFKSASSVDLDRWPSTREEGGYTVKITPPQAARPPPGQPSAVVDVTPLAPTEQPPAAGAAPDGTEGESQHASSGADADENGDSESRAAAKRRAKAEAKAKGGFKKK
ncbi:hypothetical protein KFE25_012696 [Diacronema lutheri]|uniref:Membrane insertase YidC/Oxa/ALB C-terminal domain-containing protein n=1 Tax=Diacronema lutheri TaxID=2081491 RepID=A0A8J5WZQ9_DIALT|nr:hypothetical protein KFE25_012696 [Diacronema lutheri]